MTLTKEQFNVILADPPWRIKAGRSLNNETGFNTDSSKSRDTDYPSMTNEEILAIKISDLVAKDAHLYLWVTNAHLPVAFELIKKWGFKYSTTIVWTKNRFGGGLGGTFRITTEFLLFARRGQLKANKINGSTWHHVKRAYVNGKPKHSKKPDYFYEMIEATSPGSKLELFARHKRPGWKVWGNEVECDVEI